MRFVGISGLFTLAALAVGPTPVAAQAPEPTTREAVIEQEQANKALTLTPYVPDTGERVMKKAEDILVNGGLHWHPFFENAYSGGGFALGLGYRHHVSSYNVVDVRGSYSLENYKRTEVEFLAPRIWRRHGTLSLLGGWREATQVGFFGVGTARTSHGDRTDYSFQQPYASALLAFLPTRQFLVLRGGVEWTQWKQGSGSGLFPSVETRYSPLTLAGLGATPTYIHSQGGIGFDWRTAVGYSRRGGFYGVTFHDFNDRDQAFGFERVDYEVVQHFPILREAWVISLHGAASTARSKDGQDVPFFLLPSLGGGSTLRGYESWRFRDRNSLLLQAEWRIMNNRFFESAFFYDAGKVTSRAADLNLDGLKSDYGFGIRFHGPVATPLRIDLAKSREGLALVFASSHVF
jgi:hypothetical protein